MNKVILINLNGNAYQLEEAGFDVLTHYLKEAKVRLGENPDTDEIIKDFEQAIAEKCDTYIGPHKNVVTSAEIETIIAEMGPVNGDNSETGDKKSEEKNTASENIPKRLYQIREGAWISGVCNGIALYLNIDVTIVRLFFIIITIAHGFGILVYIIMMLVVPIARTQEEKARARGERWNAHEFFENIRSKYGKYADEKYWKDFAEKEKGQWKSFGESISNKHKNKWHDWTYKEPVERTAENKTSHTVVRGISFMSQIGAGLLGIVGTLILTGLGIGWIISLWLVIARYGIFAQTILVGTSPTLLIIFFSALFFMISWPIKLLTRVVWQYSRNKKPSRTETIGTIIGAIFWGISIGVFIFIAVSSVPGTDLNRSPYGYRFYLDHQMVCIGGNGFCD